MRATRSVSITGTMLLFSFLGLPTHAQEENAKQTSARLPSEQTILVPSRVPAVPSFQRLSTDQEIVPAHRRLGKGFWLSWAAIAALSVASTELTMNCVHSPGCSEVNPMWGNKPTRLEMYGVKGALLGAGFLLSRSMKREGDPWWNLFPKVLIPVYTADTAWDAYQAAAHPHGAHSTVVANKPPSQVEIISITRSKGQRRNNVGFR